MDLEKSNSHNCSFAEGTECGDGTVTHHRMGNQKTYIHVPFLLGKARVMHLNHIMIPRLELKVVVLTVRSCATLKSDLEISLDSSVFWTDSTYLLKFATRTSAFTDSWTRDYYKRNI